MRSSNMGHPQEGRIGPEKRAYRHQLPNCRQLEVETLIPTQAIPFGIPRQGMTG